VVDASSDDDAGPTTGEVVEIGGAAVTELRYRREVDRT
jgi:hypothetical protein